MSSGGMERITWGDFVFAREVPRQGFEWREDLRLPEGWDYPPQSRMPGNESPPWLVSPGAYEFGVEGPSREVGALTAYRSSPLGLHRDFAQLDPEPAAIVKFANLYGVLGHGPLLEDPAGDVGNRVYGEGLRYWKRQIGKMASLTRAWDLARNNEGKSLRGYVKWKGNSARAHVEVEIPGWQQWFSANPWLVRLWKFGDAVEPVRYVVQSHVNACLFGHVAPSLLPLAGSVIRNVPDCLLSTLYASFALEIAGVHRQARECAAPDCTRQTIPGKSFGRYCSKKCYQRVYMRDKRKREKEHKAEPEVNDGEA